MSQHKATPNKLNPTYTIITQISHDIGEGRIIDFDAEIKFTFDEYPDFVGARLIDPGALVVQPTATMVEKLSRYWLMETYAGYEAAKAEATKPANPNAESAPRDAHEEVSGPAPKPSSKSQKSRTRVQRQKPAPASESADEAQPEDDQGAGPASFGDFHMDKIKGLCSTRVKRNDAKSGAGETWISAPFEALARCRDPNGDGWGLLIEWKDADRRDHSLNITGAAMHGDPGLLAQSLFESGLNINREQHRALQSYLCGVFTRVKKRVTKVDRTGWHDIGGNLIFQLPNETIGPAGAELVRFDVGSPGRYATKGTLKDWQNGVGALSKGHVLPVLAISTALAGPLLRLTGEEGAGINIYGQSSKGKTTALQFGAATWGDGREKNGFMRSWGASSGGVEIMAALASDTVLVLDEIGVADAKSLGASIYKIASGTGATTMTRGRKEASVRTWRVFTLSSGEFPVATKITEALEQKSRAGQSVRMLDIPADRGKNFGAFDNGGATGDAGDLSNEGKRAATTAYGTAGPAFVRKIIVEGADKVGHEAREAIATFVKTYAPAWADGQVKRAARHLGLIAAAGELAIKYGIAPWDKGEATAAAAWALKRWIASRGGLESGETYQAIAQVRLYIEKSETQGKQWQTMKDAEPEWRFTPEIWKTEVCKGLDPSFVAKTLCDRKMLLRSPSTHDGYTVVRKIQGRSTRVYVVTQRISDDGNEG